MATPTYAIVIIDQSCSEMTQMFASVRRAGKSDMQAVFQLTALKEEDTVYVRKIETIEKQTWNKNHQRKLKHYPGRRWIDTRTTNK